MLLILPLHARLMPSLIAMAPAFFLFFKSCCPVHEQGTWDGRWERSTGHTTSGLSSRTCYIKLYVIKCFRAVQCSKQFSLHSRIVPRDNNFKCSKSSCSIFVENYKSSAKMFWVNIYHSQKSPFCITGPMALGNKVADCSTIPILSHLQKNMQRFMQMPIICMSTTICNGSKPDKELIHVPFVYLWMKEHL